MKGLSDVPTLTLKPRGENRVRSGHLWVFKNEIVRPAEAPEPGGLVRVQSVRGRDLGIGFSASRSSIAVRLLVNTVFERNRGILALLDSHPLDMAALFRLRLQDALSLRQRRLPGHDALRLVYGESDFLPGLIVDRYREILVAQIGTVGMETRRSILFDLLTEMFEPQGILERSTSASRMREGLEPRSGWVLAPPAHLRDGKVWIREDGAEFLVDTIAGQKTGFFLDQRDNRKAAQGFAPSRRVLDCFCSTGGFAIQCALGGAKEVLGVDSSSASLDLARVNANKNGVSDLCRFESADCLDFLRSAADRGGIFDLIILDPPSFAREKNAAQAASRGYREINLSAMKSLPRCGLLATSSCSQIIARERFLQILHAAAKDARKTLRPLFEGTQPPDHPILLSMPETRYLKFFIFEVL